MKKLLLILLCVPLIGLGQTTGKCLPERCQGGPNCGYCKYYLSGELKSMGRKNENGEKVGLWRYFYENGNLKSQLNYNDGKREGIQKYYYENGQLNVVTEIMIDNYNKERRDGLHKEWYENGQLRKEGSVEYMSIIDYPNMPRSGSFLQGIHKWYYENGQLRKEGNYKDGKDITEKCWDKEGKKIKCD